MRSTRRCFLPGGAGEENRRKRIGAIAGKKAIWRLAHENWLSKSDLPWNFVWLAVVFCMVFLLFTERKPKIFLAAVFVVCVGGMLWSYLLMQGRMVDRVTHPLYLAQILLAAGLWGTATSIAAPGINTRSTGRIHSVMTAAVCGVILLLCILRVPGMWQGVAREQTRRGNGKPDKRGRVCVLRKTCFDAVFRGCVFDGGVFGRRLCWTAINRSIMICWAAGW